MIVAGLHQTYGPMDLTTIRNRDLINIYIPNMSSETTIMKIARIRETPNSKLSKEERRIKAKHKVRNRDGVKVQSSQDFVAFLSKMGGEK